jgi:hypothetical protein
LRQRRQARRAALREQVEGETELNIEEIIVKEKNSFDEERCERCHNSDRSDPLKNASHLFIHDLQ